MAVQLVFQLVHCHLLQYAGAAVALDVGASWSLWIDLNIKCVDALVFGNDGWYPLWFLTLLWSKVEGKNRITHLETWDQLHNLEASQYIVTWLLL